MKKILTMLFILIFGLTACSSPKSNSVNDTETKQEAIKAYIDTSNEIVKGNQQFQLTGDFTLPKSLMVKEAVNANFDISGIIDSKNNKIKIDGTITTDKEDPVSFNLLLDKTYAYYFVDGKWTKTKLDDFDLSQVSNMQANTNLKDVTKIFDTFKTSNYYTMTKDNKEGYELSGQIDDNSLKDTMKVLDQLNTTKENLTKEQQEELNSVDISLLGDINISWKTFIPKDKSFIEIYDANILLNVMQTKINIENIQSKTTTTNQKVTIPKEAKKAKESQIGIAKGVTELT